MKHFIRGFVFVFLIICLLKWNFQLNFILNGIGALENIIFWFRPLKYIDDTNASGIAFYRSILEGAPRHFTPVNSTEDIIVELFSTPEETQRIHMRIYRPKTELLSPVIVYFHGGGFVVGSITTHEQITSRLALQTGFAVVSVEYRLAPENKFPAAPLDCIAATKWIHENAVELGFDANYLIVAGDSAGGTLAAIVARELTSSMIHFQLLIYPSIPSLSRYSASRLRNYNAPILSQHTMTWYMLRYYRDWSDESHSLACPLVGGIPKDLPPALIITAEFDPLLDDVEVYAQMLVAAGVKTEYRYYAGTVHGFFGIFFLPHGLIAVDEAAAAINFSVLEAKANSFTPPNKPQTVNLEAKFKSIISKE